MVHLLTIELADSPLNEFSADFLSPPYGYISLLCCMASRITIQASQPPDLCRPFIRHDDRNVVDDCKALMAMCDTTLSDRRLLSPATISLFQAQ